jgi:hypothetical protein
MTADLITSNDVADDADSAFKADDRSAELRKAD